MINEIRDKAKKIFKAKGAKFIPCLSVWDIAKMYFDKDKVSKDEVKSIRECLKNSDVNYSGQSACLDKDRQGKIIFILTD